MKTSDEHIQQQFAFSQRRARGLHSKRLIELAREKPRFGYRRLHVLLRREGESVNHKRVHWIYRRSGAEPPAEEV